MLQFQPKNSDKKGFSLIELLVVIGIIGVLAAIAIPAYNNYRDDAGQGSLEASLKNVGKAHNICRLENTLQDCNELSEINVTCDDCDMVATTMAATDPWCVDAENGDNRACVVITGATAPPAILTSWEDFDCTGVSTTYNCSIVSGMTSWAQSGSLCGTISGCTSMSATPITATSCAQSSQNVNCTGTGVMATGTCTIATGICN